MATCGSSRGIYYPVTDAAMDTATYDEFAEGHCLTRKAMEWFWDAYIPPRPSATEITASPNQATIEQLKGLPPTLLLVDEADVLATRARRTPPSSAWRASRHDRSLRREVHDFMLLNALSQTRAPPAPRSPRPPRSSAKRSEAIELE